MTTEVEIIILVKEDTQGLKSREANVGWEDWVQACVCESPIAPIGC